MLGARSSIGAGRAGLPRASVPMALPLRAPAAARRPRLSGSSPIPAALEGGAVVSSKGWPRRRAVLCKVSGTSNLDRWATWARQYHCRSRRVYSAAEHFGGRGARDKAAGPKEEEGNPSALRRLRISCPSAPPRSRGAEERQRALISSPGA